VAGLGGGAEGDEGAGGGVGGAVGAERVLGDEVLAGEFDVLGGDVVELGFAGEPAEVGVVEADDAGVGGRADAEVEVAVGADDRAVGVVVAPGG